MVEANSVYMDLSVFHREDRKYSALWSNGYRDANWQRLARKVLKKVSPNEHSLVDLGFGKGTAMDFFEQSGFTVAGVDISAYAVEQQERKDRKVYHSSLDHLEVFNTAEFNVGFCNDVIEHVPPELVVSSLEEMARVCSDLLFISVCPTPSHHLSKEGDNLHLTVQPISWWENQFRRLGKVERIPFWFSRSARY